MDTKLTNALNSFVLYKKYSREEVHRIFDDGTKYVTGGGIWGRSGVIRPKFKDDTYLLFCLVKPVLSGTRIQYIETNGEFHWLSQPSMYPGEKKLTSLINASKVDSKVLLFAKPEAGPNYTYLGKLSYVSIDENSAKPTVITWKIKPWPAPSAINEQFVVK